MRSDKEINDSVVHYGPGPNCRKCGEPTRSGALTCERCVEKQYRKEELAHTSEFFREHPGWPIETAHDKTKLIHFVLPRLPGVAFCGNAVTQQRRDRVEFTGSAPIRMAAERAVAEALLKKHPDGKLPPVKLCNACVAVWEGMML